MRKKCSERKGTLGSGFAFLWTNRGLEGASAAVLEGTHHRPTSPRERESGSRRRKEKNESLAFFIVFKISPLHLALVIPYRLGKEWSSLFKVTKLQKDRCKINNNSSPLKKWVFSLCRCPWQHSTRNHKNCLTRIFGTFSLVWSLEYLALL